MSKERNPTNQGADAALKIAAASWIADLRKWDVFATLTFVLRKFDATRPFGMPTLRIRFFDWMTAGQKTIGRPIEGVGVVEGHRSGEPHIHAVLEMGGAADDELLMLERSWTERWGVAQVERLRSADAAAAYITKYLTPETGLENFIFTRGIHTAPHRDHGNRLRSAPAITTAKIMNDPDMEVER